MTTIRLPAEPLLEPQVIAEAIVDATYPAFELLQGMDCVIGVRVLMHDHYYPVAMSDVQRDEIAKLLPELPPLHGKMSDAEVKTFIAEFKKLSSQSNWFPSIVDQDARLSRKQRREHFQKEYFSDLRRSVDEANLIAVDGGHIRCKMLSVGAYIPYKEAVRYLESSGHVVESVDSNHKVAINAEIENPSKDTSKSAATVSAHHPDVAITQSLENNNSSIQGTDSNDVKTTPVDYTDLKTNPPILPDKNSKTVSPNIEGTNSKQAVKADHNQNNPERHIELPELIGLIGLKKTTIYAMMKKEGPHYDPSFPKYLPKPDGSSATRWSLHAVHAWMSKRSKI